MKKINLLWIMLLIFIVSIAGVNAALTDGLVSYYKLDETGSGTITDSAGVHNGSVKGTLLYSNNGKINRAVGANGEASGSNAIEIQDDNALDFSSQLTISFWANNSDCIGTSCQIMSKGSGSGVGNHTYGIYIYPVTNKICIGKLGVDEVCTTGSIVSSSYQYFVLRHNNSKNYIYVNGVLNNSGAGADFNNTLTNLTILNSDFGSSVGLVGFMDEIGLWNRSLNESEIGDLYNGGNGMAYPFTNITLLNLTFCIDNPLSSEWCHTGITDEVVSLNVSEINNNVRGTCNCTGCSITNGYCNYPLSFYVEEGGDLTSSASSFCYQESVNTSNQTGIDGSCGQNYSGNYIIASDGGAYCSAIEEDYIKPSAAVINSIYQVKHGILSIYNITLSEDCFNYYSNKVVTKMRSCNQGGSGDFSSEIFCYNGTWKSIGTKSTGVTGCGGVLNANNTNMNDGNWDSWNRAGTASVSFTNEDICGVQSEYLYEAGIFWGFPHYLNYSEINLSYRSDSLIILEGNYTWNVSCVNSTNASTISESRLFIYDLSQPTFGVGTTDETINFPQIGDVLHLSMIANDAFLDTCKLEINDTGVWENKSTKVVQVMGTSMLVFNYTIPSTSIANNTNTSWRIWCNDTSGQYNESNIFNYTVKDATYPNISLGTGNSFDSTNKKIVGKFYNNVTVNMTFFDYNLFAAYVNITCDTSGQILYWESLDINVSNVNYYNSSINVTKYPYQRCNAQVGSSDDHTVKKIDDYAVTKLFGELGFATDDNDIILTSLDYGLLDNLIATKAVDRYSFDFTYFSKKLVREFKLSSNSVIYPRVDSKYPGHFVVWNDETKRGNWIDFNEITGQDLDVDITKVSDYEYTIDVYPKALVEETGTEDIKAAVASMKAEDYKALNKDLGIDKLKFSSIGGTLINESNYTFYIGLDVNVSSLNIYDNSTFSNYSVNVSTVNSYPGFNGVVNITGLTGVVQNLTNGTYNFLFNKPGYFPQIYLVNASNDGALTYQNYTTFQNAVYIYVRNIVTLTPVVNFTLNWSNLITGKNASVVNTTTAPIVYYVNSSNYSLSINKPGYLPYAANYTLSGGENRTIIVDMPLNGTFILYDESTIGPFNISSADRISLTVFCENSSILYNVSSANQTIPITCQYRKFTFSLDYGTTNYYRTFLLTPDELNSVKIYLINLLTTQSIFNTFTLDDMYSVYINPSIYVKKNIGGTIQITADYTDIEGKIGAYLIQNQEYIIEVHSDNNPIKNMGNYNANVAGDKILRMYDIGIDTTKNVNSVYDDMQMYISSSNISGDMTALMIYNDSRNSTSYLKVSFYSRTNLATNETPTLLMSTEYYNTSQLNVQQNLTPDIEHNRDIYGVMEAIRDGVFIKNQGTVFVGDNVIDLGLADMNITQNHLQWFFLLLFSAVALMGTIATASWVGVLLIGLSLVFNYFGWFIISLPLIMMAIFFVAISFIFGRKS